MKKNVLFDKESQVKIRHGLWVAARAVGKTIGPKGRNVFIYDPMLPRITNDGVSIAGMIVLADQTEDLGAWTVRTATARANDEAGDGTSTTAVLVEATADECFSRPESPAFIKESLQKALPGVLSAIKKVSHETTKADVKRIALVSAENQEIADMVSEVMDKKGTGALVLVEDSPTSESFIEYVDGYEAQVGYLSPYFITNTTTQRAEYKDVAVLCTHKKIGTIGDLKHLYDQLDKAHVTQLVIICDDIEMGVLGALVNTKLKGMFNTLVIRAVGELLDDIAAATGATPISDSTGVSLFNVDANKHLGKASSVVSDQKKTLFISKAKTAEEKAKQLLLQAKHNKNELERKTFTKRAAKLRGGVAILKIGTNSEPERGYLKDKAEDAVNAVKSALAEGYVEGGGMTLYRISEAMKPKTVGEEILKRVLTAPLKTIIENGGEDYAQVVKNLPPGKGYNAKTGEYEDLLKSGIIDPAKVERVAIESAVSAVGELITTHASITDYVEKKD